MRICKRNGRDFISSTAPLSFLLQPSVAAHAPPIHVLDGPSPDELHLIYQASGNTCTTKHPKQIPTDTPNRYKYIDGMTAVSHIECYHIKKTSLEGPAALTIIHYTIGTEQPDKRTNPFSSPPPQRDVATARPLTRHFQGTRKVSDRAVH